nr:FAD-linked oxidase C-terminal domain-containing protein [Notoacmeibacter marinus]
MVTSIQFLKPDPSILARRDDIVSSLRSVLPDEAVVSDPVQLRAFETDGFTAYRRLPLAVVLPSSTEEVAAVMEALARKKVPVVPRGAGTSLCGGAIPQEDAVIVSLTRMSRILEVDYPNRLARVEAGVTNLSISEAVSADGFFYAPDPSSQLACTIGGNIAMNSGGAHCLKYGVTTNNLLGVTMVLYDGTVIRLGEGELDPAGLDLLGLVCGSEGQLGLVTEAIVRLIAKPAGAQPVLFGFASSEKAGDCVADIIAAGIIPVAIEFMDKEAIAICEAFAKAGYPLDAEALLIVEVEGSDKEMADQLGRIVEIARRHDVQTIKESQSATEAALIWKGRKSAFGATGRVADYICMDGTVPLSQLAYVLKETGEIVKRYGLRAANVFHAGDGNMHPLILYDVNDPVKRQKAEDAGNDILRLCVDAGGCLTGEHGVGIEKRDLMTHQYNDTDLDQMKAVRAAFDPEWIFNPSKVFPLEGRGETDGGKASADPDTRPSPMEAAE